MKHYCTCSNSDGILTCEKNTIKDLKRDIIFLCGEIPFDEVNVIDLQNQPMPKLEKISFDLFPKKPRLILPNSKQSCIDAEGDGLC